MYQLRERLNFEEFGCADIKHLGSSDTLNACIYLTPRLYIVITGLPKFVTTVFPSKAFPLGSLGTPLTALGRLPKQCHLFCLHITANLARLVLPARIQLLWRQQLWDMRCGLYSQQSRCVSTTVKPPMSKKQQALALWVLLIRPLSLPAEGQAMQAASSQPKAERALLLLLTQTSHGSIAWSMHKRLYKLGRAVCMLRQLKRVVAVKDWLMQMCFCS